MRDQGVLSLRIARLLVILRRFAIAALLACVPCLHAQTPAGPLLADSILYPKDINAATADAAGNRYFQQNNNMMKVAPDGVTVIWTASVNVSAVRLALDGAGNLYGVGFCSAPNCDVATRTFGNGSGGSLELFKVDPSGKVVYVDVFTGVVSSNIVNLSADLAVTTDGTTAITGSANCGFPTSLGSFQSTCPSNSTTHAFVAKLAPDGTMIFATFLGGTLPLSSGGTANSAGLGVALDTTGAVYAIGYSFASDFPVTAGAPFNTPGPDNAGFLVKLGTTGASEVYGTFLPGTATGVALDNNANAYVVGFAATVPQIPSACVNNIPTTPGVVEPNFPAELCPLSAPPAYVMKFNGTATGLLYSTYLRIIVGNAGRARLTRSPAIMVDRPSGEAIVWGQTLRGRLLPGDTTAPTPNAIQSVPGKETTGQGDGVIVRLSPLANQYRMATYVGGDDTDAISSLNLGADGTLYIAGSTVMNMFPATGVSGQLFATGDGFLARIAFAGVAAPFLYPESRPYTDNNPAILPATLLFNTTQVGASTTQLVGLGNYGGTTLTISGIATTGDYSQTNTCPATLAPGGHCDITVTFAPTSRGARPGTLKVTANGGSGIPTATLNGTGLAPVLSASTATVFFGSQAVGTTSAAKTVTITNTGDATLVISSLTATGDYAVINSCGGPVAPNAACSLQVAFTPTATGQRNGTITIVSNAVNSPQTVALSGGIDPDFGIGAAANGSTSQTVTAGQTASYNLVVNPVGGFSGTVSLSCSGAAANATCAVTPSSVNVSGTTPSPFTVSVTTAARSGTVMSGGTWPRPSGATGWMIASLFGGMFSLWFAGHRRALAKVPALVRSGRAWGTRGILFALVFVVLIGIFGCGGGSSTGKTSTQTGTPAGTYTIVVSATSGSTTRTQNLTLTVN